MEQDLDRLSSGDCPKLEKDAIPSLLHKNNQERNAKAMEVLGMFGADAVTDIANIERPARENVYIREVVYIEENHNDNFLQENTEMEDCLNDEPEREINNFTTETGDQNFMEAVVPAKTSFQNQPDVYKTKDILKFASMKKKSTETQINKNHINVVSKQNSAYLSKDRMALFKSKNFKQMNSNSGISLPTTMQIPANNQVRRRIVLPMTVAAKPIRIAIPATVKPPSVVNKLKYTNFNEFNKLRTQQNVNNSNSKSDDDDCILVEEQNVLTNNNAVVSADESESMRLLTTLPSSISIKVSKGGGTPVQMPQTSNNPLVRVQPTNTRLVEVQPTNTRLAEVQPTNSRLAEVQPTNTRFVEVEPSNNAVVRIQPKLRVREFSKIGDKPYAKQDKVIKLIHLMLSENQMLLACNKRNRVKIARTKPNEFKIFDNIYYYRTNEQFEKNYFFMNITRNSRHNNEIIQRNYGIYWGYPRVSCVGIVETKGILDEETKDFVFQQVKKSLFNESGQQNLKLLNVVQPVQLVREKSVSTSIPTTIEPKASLTKKVSTVVNLDGDDNQIKASYTIVQQRYNKPPPLNVLSAPPPLNVLSAPRTIRTITSSLLPTINKDRATPPKAVASQKLATITVLSNPLHARPIVRTLVTPVKAAMASPQRTTMNPVKATAPGREVSQDETRPNNELIRLSNYLTPATRKLINKLKYFELYNGEVFTVNIGPYCPAKKKPYNIVFTKNKPESNFKPVSKDLYVSKLVNYLFQAIYPFMNDGSNEPIPIPSPHTQDMNSDFTAMSMESLILSETSKIDDAINSLQSSVTKPATSLGGRARYTKAFPSPQVDNSYRANNIKKYKCSACPQSFERTYQLKRHHFVQHSSDKVMGVVPATTEFNDTEKNMSKPVDSAPMESTPMDSTPMESWPSDLELESIIKTEISESEETIQSEKSLLIPLFEESMKDVKSRDFNCQEDFSFVKCKEEPEVHMEEITTMPLLIDNYSVTSQQKSRKRKTCDNDIGEETDSAPERLQSKIENTTKMKRKRRKILNIRSVVRKSKRGKMTRKIKRSRISSLAGKSQKNVSVIPVKISEAKKFMTKWPTLTVDLVDIGK